MTAKVIPSAASFKKKKKKFHQVGHERIELRRKYTRETLSIKPPNLCHICASPRVYLFIYLFWANHSSHPGHWLDAEERSSRRALKPDVTTSTFPLAPKYLTVVFPFFKKNLPGLALPQNRINKNLLSVFHVKNGLRNIRSRSKIRVCREDFRGCCCCRVSQRGPDSDD